MRRLIFAGLLLLVGVLPAHAQTVRVAAVHFRPTLGDVPANRARLVSLTERAARGGARIVVHTEMATSGYAYFSRGEIARVAEPIPGPTTRAIGRVARRYGLYVAVGLPEVDSATRRYYNAVALVGPDGRVLGRYRKRNNLLEASYNAWVWDSIPTFSTPYGRLGIVICADMFYSQFPRLAALQGTNILLAPANVGIETEFMQVRTFENAFAMVVANRYGTEGKGTKPVAFTQESFTIPSPFAYTFTGARSAIMRADGIVLSETAQGADSVIYGNLPVRNRRTFPAVRRPGLYPLIGQDVLERYTFTQFGLPDTTVFAAAAVDPGPASDRLAATLAAAQSALSVARDSFFTLRMIVFPANYLPASDSLRLGSLQNFADANNVDLALGLDGRPPLSVLLTSNGPRYVYRRTHRLRADPLPAATLGDSLRVIDRDYARVTIVQDVDMLAPETATVLAMMGVDVVAVNGSLGFSVLPPLWRSRSAEYLHLVVANSSMAQGIYQGGYRNFPSYREAARQVLWTLPTGAVRRKQEPRFVDVGPLLRPCTPMTC
jgi:predicted amidohydrolase